MKIPVFFTAVKNTTSEPWKYGYFSQLWYGNPRLKLGALSILCNTHRVMRKAERYSHRYPRYSTVFCHKRRSLEWQNTIEYWANITRGEASGLNRPSGCVGYFIQDDSLIQYRKILQSASPRVIFTRYSTVFCHERGTGGNIAHLSALLSEYCILVEIKIKVYAYLQNW